MICLFLGAGYATRLYPLTENFPKPLLPVGEKTILDWLLDDLESLHVADEYAVVSNHRYAEHFAKWAEAKPAKITVLDDGSVSNETRLGAVRDIQFVIDNLPAEDDLLIMAGDNLLDFSLGSFLSYAKEKDAVCVMRYSEPEAEKLKKCGVMGLGDGDRVEYMVEKPAVPPSSWCCPPFYYLPKRVLPLVGKAIEAGCRTDAPGSLLGWLAGQVPTYAMQMPGKRYDVGNLESYQRIQERYRTGNI